MHRPPSWTMRRDQPIAIEDFIITAILESFSALNNKRLTGLSYPTRFNKVGLCKHWQIPDGIVITRTREASMFHTDLTPFGVDMERLTKQRLERLQQVMKQQGLGALLLTDHQNIRYATNSIFM